MSRLSSLWRNLVHRERVERDLDDEIRGALDLMVQEKTRAGLSASEARRAAALELGPPDALKDGVRDIRAGALIDGLLRDLRYAVRLLRRNPLFAATASLSLAVGIGVNSAAFSVTEAALLRSWPASAPERLVRIVATTPEGQESSFSYPDYRDLRDQTRALEGVLAYARHGTMLPIGAESHLVLDDLVSTNYFDVLGLSAARGRTFGAADANRQPVVVISDTLWRRVFNADPSVVGTTINLTNRSYAVIGIAPPGFRGLERAVPTDLWIPAESEEGETALGNRSSREFELLGRLRSGATPAQTRADLETIGRRLALAYPAVDQGRLMGLVSERDRLRGVLFPAFLFMTGVGLVLLISCANVAGLMLARYEARRREIALRLALGVSRRRLVRQLLTESTLLALVGAALGLLLAAWLLHLQPALMPPMEVEIGLDLRLDPGVVLVTVAASALTVLVFGLVPALQAARLGVVSSLKSQEQPAGRRRLALSLRSLFVLGEIALAMVLMTASALLLRSLLHSERMDLGIDTAKHVVLFDLVPGVAQYDAQRSLLFFEQAAERARSVPGVAHATFARRVLLSGSGGGAEQRVSIPGVVLPQGQPSIRIKFNAVGPHYFETVGTRLLTGRSLTPADASSSPRVVVISDFMARRFWPGVNPVGRHIAIEGRDCEIVGVVQDARINHVHESREPYLYLPFAQAPVHQGTLIVETAGDSHLVTAAIRDRVRALDPNVPMTVRTLDDILRLAFWQDRMAAGFVGVLGLLGMFLAAVGLYGVIAQMVNRRRQEIGIRVALGAGRRSVLGLVLGDGLTLATFGTGAGMVAAFGATRLMSTLLYGVEPTDPLAFAASAAVVMLVTLTATYIPARRALGVDPITVLRCE